jgi:hypothetical protein
MKRKFFPTYAEHLGVRASQGRIDIRQRERQDYDFLSRARWVTNQNSRTAVTNQILVPNM